MWIAARVKGIGGHAERRAELDLGRHGVSAFYPRQRRYYVDPRTKEEKFRPGALIPGYVFVRLQRPVDRDIVSGCYFLSYVLGSWTGDRFTPREIPGSYVTALIEHGPVDVNKLESKKPFEKGQKVRLSVNAITAILAEYQGLDDKGRAVVSVEALGKACRTHVELSRLEAAE